MIGENPFLSELVRDLCQRLQQCDCQPILVQIMKGDTIPQRSLVGRVGEVVRCNPVSGDIVVQFGPGPYDRAIVRATNYLLVDIVSR